MLGPWLGYRWHMMVRIAEIVVDTQDPDRAAEFWCAALGYRVLDRDPDGVAIAGDDSMPTLLFIRTEDRKLHKNRLHIDVCPVAGSDRDEEVERLERLGARRIDVGQAPDATFVVMADPDGNEFCVLSTVVSPEPHPFSRQA